MGSRIFLVLIGGEVDWISGPGAEVKTPVVPSVA